MTHITLTGNTVELLPLQREHAAALLDAAADGELWNLKVTHERIMPDGRKRNSVRCSIIDSEWSQVKANLQAKLLR